MQVGPQLGRQAPHSGSQAQVPSPSQDVVVSHAHVAAQITEGFLLSEQNDDASTVAKSVEAKEARRMRLSVDTQV